MPSEKRVSVNFDDVSFLEFLEKTAAPKTKNKDGKGKSKSISRFILQVLKEKYEEEYFYSKRKHYFENERFFKNDFNEMTTAELLKASAGKEIMKKTFDAIWYQMENTEVIIKESHTADGHKDVKKKSKISNISDTHSFVYSFMNYTIDNPYSLIKHLKPKLIEILHDEFKSIVPNINETFWDSEIAQTHAYGKADINLFMVSKLDISVLGIVDNMVQLYISVSYSIKRFPSLYAEKDLLFRLLDFDNIQFKSFAAIAKGHIARNKYHRLIYLEGFTDYIRNRGYFVGFLHRPRTLDEMTNYINDFKCKNHVSNINGQYIKIFMSQSVVSVDENSLKKHTRMELGIRLWKKIA